MCKVADAAMAMVNRSIELAWEARDESYYMDFVKLHKLLYLAQCSMLAQYGQTMFEEKITAHQCGPYVEGIRFIPKSCGFGKIQVPFLKTQFVRPSYRRMKVIGQVLEAYGRESTEDLIQITKETPAYCTAADGIEGDYRPEISPELMLQSTTCIAG